MILTRKIQIAVKSDDKILKNEFYSKLNKWNYICRQSANITSSHLYFQDNIKEFVYLTEDVKLKLADKSKDVDGMFTTSYRNTCYQALSNRFKGEIPSDIFSNLKDIIFKTYKEEKQDYYKGIKSLRSYKRTIPIPFSAKSFKLDNNNEFSLFNIPFILLFGKDRSGNKKIIFNIEKGIYKMSNSSIYYDDKKNKWFLLLCVDIPKTDYKGILNKKVIAKLDIEIPIILNNKIEIGNKEEYLHNRLQIQASLNRLQKALRFTSTGKNRKAKLQAIDRFHLKEKNYIQTKLHVYSNKLIIEAKRLKASTIILKSDKSINDNDFLLRNWTYYGLLQKIQYKAKKNNIEIEIEK